MCSCPPNLHWVTRVTSSSKWTQGWPTSYAHLSMPSQSCQHPASPLTLARPQRHGECCCCWKLLRVCGSHDNQAGETWVIGGAHSLHSWDQGHVVGRLYSIKYKSIFCALTRSDAIRVIRPDHWVRSEVLIPTPHWEMSWQSQHIITTSLPGCRTAFLRRCLVLDRPMSQI